MRTDVLHAVRLARMDLKLLGRNQTALFNVIVLPLLVAWMFTIGTEGTAGGGAPSRLFVLTGLPGLLLCFAVFANLVNAFTARREDLVLKRLRGGQVSPAGVLGGAALGALTVYLGQLLLLVVYIINVEDGSPPVNVPLLLLASVLGVAVFALLAAATSGLTQTAELAQITILPVILVTLVGAPMFGPVTEMPEPLRILSAITPATPVVEITRSAFLGRDSAGGASSIGEQWVAALPDLGILLAWLLVSALVARWLFRWDPRRG
jgi:ABC-2 type transport system permease protein